MLTGRFVIRIATYNVNSIRAREERLLAWLDATKPDVVLLQELKVEDDKFPALTLKALGYEAVWYGQKTYNGVAILSKAPIEAPTRGFEDGSDDEQARFIAATTFGVRVMSVYVPNGESITSDKYLYKMRFYERLHTYLAKAKNAGVSLVLGGDFNVAPEDIDCHDPVAWKGNVLFSDAERTAFKNLLDLGYVDTVRRIKGTEQLFSWWDYRMLGFPKNRGLRIDHVLVSSDLAPLVKDAGVDREARKGKQPSDHAPVWIALDRSSQ